MKPWEEEGTYLHEFNFDNAHVRTQLRSDPASVRVESAGRFLVILWPGKREPCYCTTIHCAFPSHSLTILVHLFDTEVSFCRVMEPIGL